MDFGGKWEFFSFEDYTITSKENIDSERCKG
jgi:hypothetical protein